MNVTPEPTAIKSVTISTTPRDLCVFIVAGEHSGDALGAKLMAALAERARGRIRYLGVGGDLMRAQGLVSQFPLADIAVMGPAAILARLPKLVARVYRTVAAAISAEPDIVVIIDAPEFTHPIARRIRRRRPSIPIVDFVSPSVWAWRPGRARRMRAYVDHILALLPFEPGAHARLGGPPCSYVGHPLVERADWLADLDPAPLAQRLGLETGTDVLVVLPGSRRSEVRHLMGVFGATIGELHRLGRRFEVLLPVVDSVRELVEEGLADWPVAPRLITDETDKFRAFKLARATLAASGTVTLELALAGSPMVVAYKVDRVAARPLRYLIRAQSIVLANLVLGENAFPEFIQEGCTVESLAGALGELFDDTPARQQQLAALARIPACLATGGQSPSARAAEIVLRYAEQGRAAPPELPEV